MTVEERVDKFLAYKYGYGIWWVPARYYGGALVEDELAALRCRDDLIKLLKGEA